MTTSLGVPAHALPAWAELHAAITRAGGTPCGDPSVRDMWTGNAEEQTIAADRCLSCPVMIACDQYATTAGETTGTWGGRTARDRATRRKETAA